MNKIPYKVYDEEFWQNDDPNAHNFRGIFKLTLAYRNSVDIFFIPELNICNIKSDLTEISNKKAVLSESAARSTTLIAHPYSLVVNEVLAGGIHIFPRQEINSDHPQYAYSVEPIAFFISQTQYEFFKKEFLDADDEIPANENEVNFKYNKHKDAIEMIYNIVIKSPTFRKYHQPA